MGKYIPVYPEKWAEMVKAMAENRLLKADNDRLKAEVERLTNCKAEADRLKAEVERLNDAIMRGASIPDAKPTDE
jgi:cell shape-determining protein MreC